MDFIIIFSMCLFVILIIIAMISVKYREEVYPRLLELYNQNLSDTQEFIDLCEELAKMDGSYWDGRYYFMTISGADRIKKSIDEPYIDDHLEYYLDKNYELKLRIKK